MAIKTKTFSILSFTFASVGLVALIIGFVSDRWVVSTEKEVSGFKNIGLWSACFSKFRAPAYALVDKYYDGCWWVFDREMDELRSFLLPPWFVGTQALVSVSLGFQLLAFIIMIVNAINCFPYSKYKDTISCGLTITVAVLHGLTAIFLTVAVIMFAARADNERTWLQRPDQNYLSWSFGMCVLAAFLAILSFMTVGVELHRLRLKYREAQIYMTAAPPPPSPYAYSGNKFSPVYASKPQPAYASRYPNQASGRPPDSVFAVSGAGEVYVNHAYVNDDSRQRGRANGFYSSYGRRQERRFDDINKLDNVDAQSSQHASAGLKAAEPEDVASKETLYKSDDYEESKKTNQPTLPEYVPKLQSKNKQKIKLDNTLDESCDSDIKLKKKDINQTDKQSQEQRQSRSDSRSKKSTTNRSDSEKRKKTQKSDVGNDKSDVSRSRHRSKQDDDNGDSGKETSRSRHSKRSHSKQRKQSHSRERSSSQHRNHSKDVYSSESCADSDSASVASRSRNKHRNGKDSLRKEKRHHSVSKDSSKQEKHKHSTHNKSKTKNKHYNSDSDDMSGSEYSSVQKSQKKHRKTESEGKLRSKSRDYSDTESIRSRQKSKKHHLSKSDGNTRAKSLEYSDTESIRSRQRSRRRTDQVASDGKKVKSRDFSDTESIRSKQSRRNDVKPKGTYSSYYE